MIDFFKHPLISLYILGFKAHKKLVEWFIYFLSYSRLLAEAFWLAVLPQKTIARIDNFFYLKNKKYFNDTYTKSHLNEWESAMVNNFFKNCKKIMVLASGGGRELYALHQMGFIVEGFECNQELVSYSKNFFLIENLDVSVEWAAPNHCPENGKIYDGIILGWGAYIHVKGRQNRLNLLKEIKTHLHTGSPLLLSFWYNHANMDAYCTKLFKVNTFFCKIFRTQPIEKGERLSPMSGRYFTISEIEDELQEAGFIVAHTAPEPYGHAVAVAQE